MGKPNRGSGPSLESTLPQTCARSFCSKGIPSRVHQIISGNHDWNLVVTTETYRQSQKKQSPSYQHQDEFCLSCFHRVFSAQLCPAPEVMQPKWLSKFMA